MVKQVTVALTMEQAEAILAFFGQLGPQLSPTLLDALDAIESTIVNEHGEDETDEPYDQEHDDDYWDRHSEYDEDEIRNRMFANPGGNSALRAASKDNPRDQPCPTCHRPNLLTPADIRLGYQCDRCSDRAERGVDY